MANVRVSDAYKDHEADLVPLAPTGMELRGGDGPQVTFVPASSADALDVADDQGEALFDEGWSAGDIALITLGQRHPVQVERQDALGQQGYWDTFWDADDIFYGHVLGFKGMERRAVVLCVNESGTRDRAAERVYVGLPGHRPAGGGRPDVITSMGGPEVYRRMGIHN